MCSLVTSIFLYACESWTLTAELQRGIQAIEMLQDTMHLIPRLCYQQGSPCQDPVGNRLHEDLLTIVKRRKLQWYGHASRSSDLAKTILQGTVKGERRQGRQRNRWEDNKSQRAVENREKWRKLFAKSSVVPQQPLCLRDG